MRRKLTMISNEERREVAARLRIGKLAKVVE